MARALFSVAAMGRVRKDVSMSNRRRILRNTLVPVLFVAATMSQAKPVRLVTKGKSDHQIVLHPGASPSERHAAEELQSHVKLCTGVELPISEGKPPDGVVGQ